TPHPSSPRTRPAPRPPLSPYTTLFRSQSRVLVRHAPGGFQHPALQHRGIGFVRPGTAEPRQDPAGPVGEYEPGWLGCAAVGSNLRRRGAELPRVTAEGLDGCTRKGTNASQCVVEREAVHAAMNAAQGQGVPVRIYQESQPGAGTR